jgi:hypothetical protein
MLANKQCIMIEGHWFNNSKNFSFLKNLEDTKLRIFFHNPDLAASINVILSFSLPPPLTQ